MTLSKIADTLNMAKDEREPFVQMAKYFEADVVENLTKSHFDLADETEFTYDQWQAFMSEPAIAGWISSNVKMLASVAERRKLQRLGEEGTNTADSASFKALKDFNDQGKTIDHSNVVIVHLPNLDGEET
jgi:hypothetical protein